MDEHVKPATKITIAKLLAAAAACALAVIGTGLAGSTAAEAQTVVMLPAQKDVSALEALHQQAAAQVYQTLVSQAVRVVADEEEVERKLLEKGLRACGSASTCAQTAAKLMGVDYAVSTVVWRDSQARSQPASVAVALVAPDGASHAGRANITAGVSLDDAAQQATLKALQRLANDQLNWLHVTSTPAGATVEIDGQPSGHTPYKRRVAVGEHEVQIKKPGYATRTARVHVTVQAPARVSLALVPGQSANSPTSNEDSSEWWIRYGLPGAVAGAGAAGLLVLGGVALFATGCESRYSDGSCERSDELALAPALIVGGISGALLLAGGAILIWNLTEENAHVEQGVALEFRPGGVAVKGTF